MRDKMTALMSIGAFFLLLVTVYPAVCAAISLLGAARKRKALRSSQPPGVVRAIDDATDRLKNAAFIISLVVTFFVAAPFIVLILIADYF
jgi:hypothetical protein